MNIASDACSRKIDAVKSRRVSEKCLFGMVLF